MEPTLAEMLKPYSRSPGRRVVLDGALVVAGSLAVAALAWVSIPLPFTPVPITGQTFGVLLTGAVLGSRMGAISLAFYVLLGAFGLPVFSAGKSGLAALTGPTAGYLAGFVAAAFAAGLVAEKGLDRRICTAFPAFFLVQMLVYALGVPWLARFVGGKEAVTSGLLPFIAGQALKAASAAVLMAVAWAAVGRCRRAGPRLSLSNGD